MTRSKSLAQRDPFRPYLKTDREDFVMLEVVNVRGAALQVVLVLITLVLVIGLAMGSLSVMSLRMSERHVTVFRTELAARRAIATLLAKLRQLDESRKLDPFHPDPIVMAKAFPRGLTVSGDGYVTQITFQASEKRYSTDNLLGETSVVGWSDTDGVARVAPFSLDVILDVEGPSDQAVFRVGLRQVWPYAIYSAGGPIILMCQPKLGDDPMAFFSTLVNGDLFTSWKKNEAYSGGDVIGYGLGTLDSPSKLLAFLEAREGYQPESRAFHPLEIGKKLAFNDSTPPTRIHEESSSLEQFFSYGQPLVAKNWHTESLDPTFGAKSIGRFYRSSKVVGNLYYDYDADNDASMLGFHLESEMEGRMIRRRHLAVDPLEVLERGAGGSPLPDSPSFQRLNLTPVDETLKRKFDLLDLPSGVLHSDHEGEGASFLLDQDLVLTEAVNSTGGPLSTHYEVEGSLSNRQVLYSERDGTLYVRQRRHGLQLENVFLHVKGDLDLGAIDPDGPGGLEVNPVVVSGSDATLWVDGSLILGNAVINAQDRAFVIYARHIVLKGGGDFRGLMIARDSISLLAKHENMLTIRGGILCAGRGGVCLRGASVIYDPASMKAIHAGGDFQVSSWKKL